jgi:hypothetical protein
MIENEHTVCDTCDKDTGSFVKHNEQDLCEYCWKELCEFWRGLM